MNDPTFACLSIRQPWASLIAAGIKPCENRSWACKYRGSVLIHASKTWKADEQKAYEQLMNIAIMKRDTRRQDVLYSSQELKGGIIGVARMRSCIGEEEWYRGGGQVFDGWQNWYIGPFGFFFTGARMFRGIIPYKGQQGLFRVPARVVAGHIEEKYHA